MNPGNFTIRELRPEDSIPGITALLHEAYAQWGTKGLKFMATWQDDATTARRLHAGISFVAEQEGKIAGVVTLRSPHAASTCPWYSQPGVWTFGQFAVRPALQRHGLGSRLLDWVEERASVLGGKELALDTAEPATQLVEWYQRLGFRFIQHHQWEETNYRSVVLSKSLNSKS